MTWNSTMSSGYSSLEEDSEEYFFTARTSFFRKPLGKVSESKVRTQNTRLLSAPDRWMKIIRCFKFLFIYYYFNPERQFQLYARFIHTWAFRRTTNV